LVKLLLDAGAHVEIQQGEVGETALHQAAREGWIEVARLLLDRGAKIDWCDQDHRTALCLAVACGREEMVQMLLERKADPNEGGVPALHVAAWFGRTKLGRLLLAHKAKPDVQVRDTYGGTALHQAARNNAREKNEGKTPLHLAIEVPGKDNAVARFLNPFGGYNEVQVLPLVTLLLAHKADVTVKDNEGRSPLALAKKMKYKKVSDLLRKHGAKR
jgi:ankyrin repeat protein